MLVALPSIHEWRLTNTTGDIAAQNYDCSVPTGAALGAALGEAVEEHMVIRPADRSTHAFIQEFIT